MACGAATATGSTHRAVQKFARRRPRGDGGISTIAQSALSPKALDGKTMGLIVLGICVAAQCDDCITFHVKAAFEQGASRAEVTEALGMAIYMRAGP
jgi:AhpD family alkylhydroperoxidase